MRAAVNRDFARFRDKYFDEKLAARFVHCAGLRFSGLCAPVSLLP
jgi:hypothetical protein